jgi:hypothetical protein
MALSHKHVGSKIPAKINTYCMLTRAELLITLCYETPCSPSDIFTKRTVRSLELEGRGRGIVMGSDTLVYFKVLCIESVTTEANNTSYKSFMTVGI